MVVEVNRASAATLTNLRLMVREELGDLLGDTAPAADQERFSDTKIDRALIYTMFQMYRELSEEDPGANILEATMTYTADAESVALPSGVEASPIYKIELVDSQSQRVLLRRVGLRQLEESTSGDYVWTLLDRSIAIRPKPQSALDIRVWYVGNPFNMTGGTPSTDQHPYPVAHEELLVLGAVRRLASRDQEWTPVQEARYQEAWRDFQIQAARYQGRVYPASTRRFV